MLFLTKCYWALVLACDAYYSDINRRHVVCLKCILPCALCFQLRNKFLIDRLLGFILSILISTI